MRIKCWGSRGSISVSGQQYVKYGGDTTCFEIQADSGHIIIIDAGTGIRRLGRSLVHRGENRFFLLMTHTHWDHILGLPFFHPLLRKDGILIAQNRKFGALSTQEVFAEVMKDPFFPVRLEDYQSNIRFDPDLTGCFSIGSIDVECIATSHSKGSLGYKFTENKKVFVFMTDNELGFSHDQGRSLSEYTAFCKNADILFHDTEYTDKEYACKKGWGHSSVSQVLDLACAANVGQLGLIHINQDRTDDQMDDMVDQCRLFFKTQKKTTQCYGVSCDLEIFL